MKLGPLSISRASQPQQKESTLTAPAIGANNYDIGTSGSGRTGLNIPLTSLSTWFKWGMLTPPLLQDPIYRPLTSFSQFIEPKYSFAQMLYAYENDAEIAFGLDWATAVTVGVGYHFTAGIQNTGIVDYITQFAENINLDEIALVAGREALGYGNSLWTYKEESLQEKSFDRIEPMPLTSLKRIWWNGPGINNTVGFYEFRGYTIVRMIPAELIHFRWRISNAQPFGLGLLAPIISKTQYTYTRNGQDETRQRMSLFDIKNSFMDTFHKIAKRYVPRNVYNAKAATPKQASDMQAKVDNLLDEQDMVMSGETNVFELGRNTRAIDLESFDKLAKNEIIKALATPVSKLYEDGSLTEASSNVAKETALMHFGAFQRLMSRDFMLQIFKPWYMANPYTDANGVAIPWKEAKLVLHWGMAEKPKMEAATFVDLLKARPSAFSDQEVRNYASQGGVELMPDTWTAEQLLPTDSHGTAIPSATNPNPAEPGASPFGNQLNQFQKKPQFPTHGPGTGNSQLNGQKRPLPKLNA